jgi:hypothetical protein
MASWDTPYSPPRPAPHRSRHAYADGIPTKITVIHDKPTDPAAFETEYGAASAAVTTPEAGELFPIIFGLGTGGQRILFSDIEES